MKRGNSQLKRSGFKAKLTATGLKPRKAIRRVGKVGKANLEANQAIREYLEMHPINSCELMLDGCLGNMFLQVAHKHKRAWYKGDVTQLSNPNEWVCACTVCHNIIEHDLKLTESVFKRLRV